MTSPLDGNTSDLNAMITIDPKTCSGQPVFTGTRVLVAAIVSQLRSGVPRQELEADFPQIGNNALDWAQTLTPASHD
jgi:uncharacterized protein (DUF433 family)